MINSLLAFLFLSLEIALLPTTIAKKNSPKDFYFSIHNQSLQNDRWCSLSGVRTVHLPKHSRLNMRIHFKTLENNNYIHLEAFDARERRLNRIELRFFQGHLQINHNGQLSPWMPAKDDHNDDTSNELEITSNLKNFRLNSQIIPIEYIEASDEGRPKQATQYDESAQPDDEWIDLFNDSEIRELLNDRLPHWNPPLQESTTQHNRNLRLVHSKEVDKHPNQQIDYIVYDDQIISQFEVTSRKHLPKLKRPVIKSQRSQRIKFSINWKRQRTGLAVYNTLPMARATKLNKKRVMGGIVVAGFIGYLLLLIRLSKMTSKRCNANAQNALSITKTALISQSKVFNNAESTRSTSPLSNSHSQKLSKSSSSRVLSIDFSDAPQLKSTISTDGSVLKLTVPAALSLADNRHIIFPSKLRNFQK